MRTALLIGAALLFGGAWLVGTNDRPSGTVVELALDVDGDGKADLVRRSEVGGEAWVEVWLSDGAGFEKAWSGAVGQAGAEARELAADVDGDGAAELVRRIHDDGRAWVDVWRWTGTRLDLVSSSALGAWRDDATELAMDVDGDGLTDLVRRYSEGGEAWAEVWRSDGSAFALASSGPMERCAGRCPRREFHT